MKIEEFWKNHGLEGASVEMQRQFFARNLHSGIGPVSVAFCPYCHEVLVKDYTCPYGCNQDQEGKKIKIKGPSVIKKVVIGGNEFTLKNPIEIQENESILVTWEEGEVNFASVRISQYSICMCCGWSYPGSGFCPRCDDRGKSDGNKMGISEVPEEIEALPLEPRDRFSED